MEMLQQDFRGFLSFNPNVEFMNKSQVFVLFPVSFPRQHTVPVQCAEKKEYLSSLLECFLIMSARLLESAKNSPTV